MDRLSIISSALFLTADVFAVASLALPRWIVSDIGGMWIHCENKVKTRKAKQPINAVMEMNTVVVNCQDNK